MAKIVYVTAALCVPKWIINIINKEFYGFVWKYKRDKIARKVLINSIENGGLNMIDFRAFCIAMKAVWATRLYNNNKDTWTIIPQKYFEKCDVKTMLCMNIEHEKHIPIQSPVFYQEVIKSWHLCGGGKKAPQNAAEIRKEILWGNKFIQSKGKTLFFKHWKDSNINHIDDTIDQDGNIVSGEELFAKLKLTTNWLVEYKVILKAIPKSWKEKLKLSSENVKIKKDLKPCILANNKYMYDLPIKAKGYYDLLVKTLRKRSFNEKYWTKLFPDRPEWSIIYESRVEKQMVKKLSEFHFKILHRILPCQENLRTWRLSDTNKCRFGCDCTENYNHLFIACPRLKNLISLVETICCLLGYGIKITYKTLVFGYKCSYEAYNRINILISHVFYAIYKYWIKNDSSIDIKQWVLHDLIYWEAIYQKTKVKNTLIKEFLSTWKTIVCNNTTVIT